MDIERDTLARQIEPVVNSRLEDLGLAIELVDLRWGIHPEVGLTEQAVAEQIISTCLDEIRRCPVFVGFVGQARGWIPPSSVGRALESLDGIAPGDTDRSITELEMLLAARSPTARHVLVYVRDDVHDAPHLTELERDGAVIRPYRREVGSTATRGSMQQSAIRQLTDDLEAAIRELAPTLGSGIDQHAAWLVSHPVEIFGRDPELDEIMRIAARDFLDRARQAMSEALDRGDTWAELNARRALASQVVVTAEPGGGLSAFAAALEHRARAASLPVASISTEESAERWNLADLLSTLADRVRVATGPARQVDTSPARPAAAGELGSLMHTSGHSDRLLAAEHELLAALEGANAPVLVIVDGIDERRIDRYSQYAEAGLWMDRLRERRTPATLVVTARAGSGLDAATEDFAPLRKIELPALGRDDVVRVIRRELDVIRRDLPESVIDLLARSSNPTPKWVKVVLGHLLRLGADDYADARTGDVGIDMVLMGQAATVPEVLDEAISHVVASSMNRSRVHGTLLTWLSIAGTLSDETVDVLMRATAVLFKSSLDVVDEDAANRLDEVVTELTGEDRRSLQLRGIRELESWGATTAAAVRSALDVAIGHHDGRWSLNPEFSLVQPWRDYSLARIRAFDDTEELERIMDSDHKALTLVLRHVLAELDGDHPDRAALPGCLLRLDDMPALDTELGDWLDRSGPSAQVDVVPSEILVSGLVRAVFDRPDAVERLTALSPAARLLALRAIAPFVVVCRDDLADEPEFVGAFEACLKSLPVESLPSEWRTVLRSLRLTLLPTDAAGALEPAGVLPDSSGGVEGAMVEYLAARQALSAEMTAGGEIDLRRFEELREHLAALRRMLPGAEHEQLLRLDEVFLRLFELAAAETTPPIELVDQFLDAYRRVLIDRGDVAVVSGGQLSWQAGMVGVFLSEGEDPDPVRVHRLESLRWLATDVGNSGREARELLDLQRAVQLSFGHQVAEAVGLCRSLIEHSSLPTGLKAEAAGAALDAVQATDERDPATVGVLADALLERAYEMQAEQGTSTPPDRDDIEVLATLHLLSGTGRLVEGRPHLDQLARAFELGMDPANGIEEAFGDAVVEHLIDPVVLGALADLCLGVVGSDMEPEEIDEADLASLQPELTQFRSRLSSLSAAVVDDEITALADYVGAFVDVVLLIIDQGGVTGRGGRRLRIQDIGHIDDVDPIDLLGMVSEVVVERAYLLTVP